MNILLSIKPEYAKLIYEGKKTIEWRKHSSWDGDNETKEIKHGIVTYRFFNHYWD